MDRVKQLSVFYDGRNVGKMALYQNRLAAFEYSEEWLAEGFSLSPFSLPLDKKVFLPKMEPLEGLFGVFADSLPDGWGRFLVDRLMRKRGIDPQKMGNLDRLAIVGSSGMGALTYRPEINLHETQNDLTLDEIASECARLLKTEYSDELEALFQMGSSTGGARPKILTVIDGEDWIIKFPSSDDRQDIGKMEYDYAMCAKECSLEMEEIRLFPSKRCKGYFGTRRFDRVLGENCSAQKDVGASENPAKKPLENSAKNRTQNPSKSQPQRIHMVSAAGLLETSHRIPNLDYELLMRLTLQLTKDMRECEKLYRLMCFNVFAHNRDDHSRNFTYLYLDKEDRWVLSPAYDLTYSNSIGGEHATTVNGNGVNPGMRDILAVAKGIGIDAGKAKRIAGDVQDCVEERLKGYL